MRCGQEDKLNDYTIFFIVQAIENSSKHFKSMILQLLYRSLNSIYILHGFLNNVTPISQTPYFYQPLCGPGRSSSPFCVYVCVSVCLDDDFRTNGCLACLFLFILTPSSSMLKVTCQSSMSRKKFTGGKIFRLYMNVTRPDKWTVG